MSVLLHDDHNTWALFSLITPIYLLLLCVPLPEGSNRSRMGLGVSLAFFNSSRINSKSFSSFSEVLRDWKVRGLQAKVLLYEYEPRGKKKRCPVSCCMENRPAVLNVCKSATVYYNLMNPDNAEWGRRRVKVTPRHMLQRKPTCTCTCKQPATSFATTGNVVCNLYSRGVLMWLLTLSVPHWLFFSSCLAVHLRAVVTVFFHRH